MPVMKGRALLIAVAAVTTAGALDGCGGSLSRPVPADGGSTGAAGSGAPTGSAGTQGATAGTQGATAGTQGATAGTQGAAAGTQGAAGGTTGAGGSTAAAGTSGGPIPPTCPATVFKGSACGPNDVQFCNKPCGPQNTGWK